MPVTSAKEAWLIRSSRVTATLGTQHVLANGKKCTRQLIVVRLPDRMSVTSAHEAVKDAGHSSTLQVQSPLTMKFGASLIVGLLSLAAARGDSIIKSTYTSTKGLNDLAKATGRYMGTATDNGELSDPYYVKQLKNGSEFGMITPGNAMKWDATEPSQNYFSFTKGDQIVATAKASGAKVRCHTLVWHQQVPSWVQNLGKADLLKALTNHITKVMTHFGDSCYAWDVVNEAMGDDGSYRKSFWYTKTGTEYISTAFKTASAVKKSLGLKTKLYYNDYNTNTINTKSTAVLNLVKSLITSGIEINATRTRLASDQISNMRRFEALKLDVALTELDVKTSSTAPSASEQNKQVAVYRNAVLACKKLSKCVGVTIWDFVDTYTWLSSSAPLPWYQPKGKNTPLVRKAAYDGIAKAWQS
ncbi:Endo-1 [Phytophthora citrophthora]|uniref:endo-1,4-beta-xylanase n=1 Tax=Phytophthora citrophthora TaxID=4793 RepID=A0AAD9G3X1_9STRA|nr:Endo-1 [Phytophthora citrophthora]